jgi:paraquat-inducible protein A
MSGTRRDPLTGLMLLAALVLLGVGLFLPAVTVEKFFIFDNTKSVAGSIAALFAQGHILLGVIVATFSLVFPLAKLVLSFRIWIARDPTAPGVQRAIRWTVKLGKWSMLDVFMAALVVAILTLGMVASVTVHVGLYIFAGAIVVAMLAAHRLEDHLGKRSGGA